MALTIAQLRNLHRIQVEDATERPLVFTFYDLQGAYGILFEQLLFRLQNHPNPVKIYLKDVTTVNASDAELGIFTLMDVGATKGLTLLTRYAGVFPNVTIVWLNQPTDYPTHTDVNALHFDIGSVTALETPSLIPSATADSINAFRLDVLSRGVQSEVAFSFKKQGEYWGETIDVLSEDATIVSQNILNYPQQALLSNRLFNYVNALISGHVVTVGGFEGDILHEQLDVRYLIGLYWKGFNSRYKVALSRLFPEQREILEQLGMQFDEAVVQEVTPLTNETLTELQKQTLLVKNQLNYFIQLYRSLANEVTRDEWERVQMVTIATFTFHLMQSYAEEELGEDYNLRIIELLRFLKENVAYADIL